MNSPLFSEFPPARLIYPVGLAEVPVLLLLYIKGLTANLEML